MPDRTPEKLRTVAFVGHGGSGKTTLADACLFKAGASTRQGSVEEGTSVFSADEESRARKISVDSSAATVHWKGSEVTILDCPGYSDFIGAVYAGLTAVEAAVIVVNATAGIEVGTRKAWELAVERGVPRLLALTRLDGENVRLEEILSGLREMFGPGVVLATAVDRPGPDCGKAVNLLSDGRATPEGKALLEKIVEAEDALMEKYLAEEPIPEEELLLGLRTGVRKGTLIPVLSTAAAKGIGVAEALDLLAAAVPAPAERAPREAKAGADGAAPARSPLPGEPFSAQVFKLVTDQYVGKVIFLKVLSGTLRPDTQAYHPRSRKNLKIAQFFRPFGKELQPLGQAVVGDIAVLTKLDELEVSDTLADPKSPIEYPPLAFPEPMVSLAASAKNRGDEAKMSTALKRLASEDPTFKSEVNPQTKELVISGMSSLHLDMVIGRLKRRDVLIETRPPKIPYLETITAKAEGKYRHKKQTGGHGQYGEVYLRVEPLPRGAGFEFVDEIKGGVIPNQFIPSCQKGIVKALERGIVAGCPVVDVRAAVHYGSYHDVDSSDAAFQVAASRAFQIAAQEARPVVLEPIMNMEVTIPPDCSGDIMGDLNSRRGRIQGMETLPGLQIIKAEAPLAEITTYAADLRSMTHGRADYKIAFARYDIAPFKIQEGLAAKYQASKAKEAEE